VIIRGAADVVIAGGAESKLNPMGLLRQQLLKRLSNSHNDNPAEACRPFDVDHDGTIIGEGGGLLILEEMEHARQRGAKIYAEVVGFGAACDPQGMDVTQPNAGGLDLAVTKALADAGITPDQVDMIVAHGTGVPGEDRCESLAWQQAMGQALADIPAVAVTGATGSLYAGAGGIELATAALAIREQKVPPTVNFTAPAEGCGLLLSSEARSKDIEYVVTAAFSVGGQSGACVLKRIQE
jgi:3-oxoacyl-[acyl-carrier-protein] synthase II